MTGAEATAYRKLCRGVEDERVLAEKIEELLPGIEKEEARVAKARRKIAQALQLAEMAEVRTTRTRRSARKVDYSYADDPIEVGVSSNIPVDVSVLSHIVLESNQC